MDKPVRMETIAALSKRRLLGDWLVGDIPFFQLTFIGGLQDAQIALGGLDNLRGLPLARYRGRGKLLANGELRYTSSIWHFGQKTLELQPIAFVDAGHIWDEADGDTSGPLAHVSTGGGFRIAWNRDFVIRADAGFGLGDDAAFGFYLSFGQVF